MPRSSRRSHPYCRQPSSSRSPSSSPRNTSVSSRHKRRRDKKKKNKKRSKSDVTKEVTTRTKRTRVSSRDGRQTRDDLTIRKRHRECIVITSEDEKESPERLTHSKRRTEKKHKSKRQSTQETSTRVEAKSDTQQPMDGKSQRKILTQEELDELEMIEKACDGKRCPQCFGVVVRDGGCAKMTCWYCKTLFCFRCGRDVSVIRYGHFCKFPAGVGCKDVTCTHCAMYFHGETVLPSL